MFSKIIVPLDGSEFGELALSTALGVATESGASVCLATVVSTLTPPRYTQPVTSIDQETYRDAEAHARAYQRSVVEKIRESGIEVPISTFVGVGRVVDTLDRKVRESGADLLVIATHGRGPLMRSWLGSVADGLVRCTPCPVLIIRPEKGEVPELTKTVAFKNILVALDGSTEATEILGHVPSLASPLGAQVSLLRVIPPYVPAGPPHLPHLTPEEADLASEAESAARSLSDASRTLREMGLEVETHVMSGSHPADGILSFAREKSPDAIALTTHGRGGITRMLLGSVVDKVVRAAHGPVLVYRSG